MRVTKTVRLGVEEVKAAVMAAYPHFRGKGVSLSFHQRQYSSDPASHVVITWDEDEVQDGVGEKPAKPTEAPTAEALEREAAARRGATPEVSTKRAWLWGN